MKQGPRDNQDAFPPNAAIERSEEVLNAYAKAFSGFTEEEMSILDGIILEPATTR